MKPEQFIRDFSKALAEQVIADAPHWADTYCTSTNEYRRRSKQLVYMADRVSLQELKIELKQIELGRKLSFKERQALKSESIYGGGESHAN
ncbi:hypothetical protein ITF40_16760 [Acinetobacter baumannii]|nr:hypothetical protein [Acinetobacter baumannii]